IPTFAVLDPGFNLGGRLRQAPVYAQGLDRAIFDLLAADQKDPRAQEAAREMNGLAAYVPNEFTAYSGPSGTNEVLTATLTRSHELHNTNGFPAYYDFHAFRGTLETSVSALTSALKLKSFRLQDANGQREVIPASPDW